MKLALKNIKIFPTVMVLLVLSVIVTQCYVPTEVRALNKKLASDDYLNQYPYHFKVLTLENGVATMSSPRSSRVSVPEMIGTIVPELKNPSLDDPRYLKAQKDLADHQAYARRLVIEDIKVKSVRWRLDKRWLRERGIMVE